MKTNLFLLGMAVAALSSCTNEEVTDVAQNRAIKFNQFVENNTRVVTELNGNSELTSFYVFGKFGSAKGNYDTQIFNNELQTTSYYWVADKNYIFGAYANGDGGQLNSSEVSFKANDGILTFSNYTPDDAKDLVAAISENVECKDAVNQGPVSLNFQHMLSQVKFTFKTTDGDEYTLSISDLKFNALHTATCTYTKANNTIEWTGDTNNDYVYLGIADVADVAKNNTVSSESKLVIPQNKTNQLKVTFTATITGAGLDKKTADFEATLDVDANIAGTSDANTWMPGYRYNYTATINGDDIDPSLEQQKIEFTPSVTPWEDATGQPVTPQPVVP